MRHLALFVALSFAAMLLSCGEDKNAQPAAPAPQQQTSPAEANQTSSKIRSSSNQTPAVPGRSEYDPVSPDISPLPPHMAFDPCSLLSSDVAQTLNIPMDQRIERIGGTRKIPEDHRYTPYIGCIWRSVARGVPRVAVEIQQGAENLKVNGDPNVELGDAAWYGERNGRAELRMHLGNYVIFVRAELPHDQLDTKQVHEAIAKHLADSLKAPPKGSRIALDASMFGGPELNVCEVAKNSGIADLLPGPEAWAFPTGAMNQVPDDQSSKPDADYVGCTFAGSTRGSVQVRYLGPHGIKRQLRLYDNKTPVTINGMQAWRNRNGVYLPFGDGAFELIETMTPFDDELLPQKIENIMKYIVATVSK